MIDVIMPTYNRALALRKVIDSYMSQEHLGKIIFVDDCSTDDTGEFVKELEQKYSGKILYHRMDAKSTLPNLRNIGISLAQNEYIFMGEDDVLLPIDHFKILLGKMNHYGADIISGRRIYIREGESQDEAVKIANCDDSPIFVRVPFEGYFERVVNHAQKVFFTHSNSLMKRSIFDSVKYDPWYGGNAFREELDFYLRATDAGFSIWLIPDTISFHLKNALINSNGGSRKKRLIYEFQVWRNTVHCFWKNRKIFKNKFQINCIVWFTLRCLLARYSYAFRRRVEWFIHRKNI